MSGWFLLPLFVLTCFAQVPRIPFGGGFSGGPNGIKGDATFNPPRSIQMFPNAPYSGEEKNANVQTLADGTHVTRTMPPNPAKVWRDIQGRVRIEQPLGGGGNPNFKTPTLVQIEDPVAGYVYIMDDITKVAHRLKTQSVQTHGMEPMMRLVPPPNAVAAGTRAAANASPRMETSGPEDLGTQTINGVSAHGTRTTMVIPTGAQGNDGPIRVTRESWYSAELNLVVRTVSNDPRSGVQTTEVGNLSRNNPDANLFVVPPDYTIVDESGSFTIKWDTSSK